LAWSELVTNPERSRSQRDLVRTVILSGERRSRTESKDPASAYSAISRSELFTSTAQSQIALVKDKTYLPLQTTRALKCPPKPRDRVHHNSDAPL